MKSLFVLLITSLIICSMSVSAQTQKEKPKSSIMKGYLMDKMCGSPLSAKSPVDAMAKASKHTRECALEEGCAASGYGLIMNGKWIPFDEAGSKKAAEYLNKTKAVNHLYVSVSGKFADDKISVLSIKELKE
jgi:hypothetical protein